MEANRVDQLQEEIYKKGQIVREKTELTGMTALHKACQYGRLANVEKLLNEGADVGAKNHWNANCLHWTVKGFVHNQGEDGYEERKQHWIQIAKLLIQTSRKLLEDQDSLGRTPLMLARELESTDMVSCLQKKEDEIRSMRIRAEEKRIKNKPKARRLDD